MAGDACASPDHQPAGVVELREDVPLKAGGGGGGGVGGGGCARGPRVIAAAFAALSAAVTLALLTQIYYGDYEVVPHGAVAAGAAACSRAGADALKAGGAALDAAAAAALCLAVLAPHRTSLDASGALLYWDYRASPLGEPMAAEWGGLQTAGQAEEAEDRPPRMVAALAALHGQLGRLPWPRLLQPAIDLAREGFVVSEGLAAVEGGAAGGRRSEPLLARFLQTLQRNSSAELTSQWGGEAGAVRWARPRAVAAGGWRAWAAGPAAQAALAALAAALGPPPAEPDAAIQRAVQSLQAAAAAGGWPTGVAAGLAAVDSRGAYLALVTGLSMPFGSGPSNAAGWRADRPTAPVDLAPAVLADDQLCGTRYVVGAESGAALAQAAAALALAAGGVERPRLAVLPAGLLAAEGGAGAGPPLAARPYAAANVVQQRADALLSHADSRGGGLASRF